MPRFNSPLSEDGQRLTLKKYINIGVAVDTPNGLVCLLYTSNSQEDGEPENILKIVKEWRRSQGLPLFKDSK